MRSDIKLKTAGNTSANERRKGKASSIFASCPGTPRVQFESIVSIVYILHSLASHRWNVDAAFAQAASCSVSLATTESSLLRLSPLLVALPLPALLESFHLVIRCNSQLPWSLRANCMLKLRRPEA